MRLPFLVLITAIVVAVPSCAGKPQRPAPMAVAGLEQFPRYRWIEGCPAAAKAVVRRFGLPADSIHQCLSQRFALAPGDTVALAHTVFGTPDCWQESCLYDYLCAVVDKDEVLPFAYHFRSHSAPWIGPGAVSSHHAPGYLTGRRHRIVRDSSFLQFHHAIIRGGWEGVPSTVWRYCTDLLPLDMSLDIRLQPQN